MLIASTPLASGIILGDPIVITPGMIIYFAIAAVVGVIAEFIVGWRLPFGILGAIVAALIGIWLLNNVIQVSIPGDFTVLGQPIPIIKAFLGAIVVVAIWHLVTFNTWRGREHYVTRRRRRRDYYDN
jgi:uncharacterized membrane protein YeaQ/YmgE (transglycosylase-associated protein family)